MIEKLLVATITLVCLGIPSAYSFESENMVRSFMNDLDEKVRIRGVDEQLHQEIYFMIWEACLLKIVDKGQKAGYLDLFTDKYELIDKIVNDHQETIDEFRSKVWEDVYGLSNQARSRYYDSMKRVCDSWGQ